MAEYLALDTSGDVGAVAVGAGDRVRASVTLPERARQAAELVPAVDRALSQAGLAPDALDGVVVAGGPGSFTGVRVAGATAKGLVRALGVPLYAYSGLLSLAAALDAGRPVCALFDARRREVYAGCWRFTRGDGGPPTAGRSGPFEELLAPMVGRLEAVLEATTSSAPIYAGDGALRYGEAIERAGGTVGTAEVLARRADGLLRLVELAPELGRVEKPDAWEPEYLRASSAERGVRG